MKPTIPALLLSALVLAVSLRAAETTPLERAILELPGKVMADVPLDKRDAFLKSLHSSPTDTRLDLEHHFLHYSSDGGDHGAHLASSMLFMKEFHRTTGGAIVLVHMPKPFANGSAPEANQTFVFERRGGKWEDITKDVFPEGIDMTAHFRPKRADDIVRLAPYTREKRADGRGDAWVFGPVTSELHWNGKTFDKKPPTKKVLTWD